MRRTTLIAITIAALFAMVPATAMAWCNGPAAGGKVGNGYGSHDWIVDQAIKAAGADGTWVVRHTALIHTDDPDTLKWPETYHHFFESGSCRGGPYMVALLYHKAIVAYQASDTISASVYLGQLGHIYGDLLQPFHTSSKANSYKSLHNLYEHLVDDHQHKSTGVLSWITKRAPIAVTDVRAKAVAAALYSRGYFPSLLKTFKASHKVTKGTPLLITKRVMSRAVNDMADIIRGIKAGSGEATAPASTDMEVSRTYPHPNTLVGGIAVCTDVNGKPIDGVGVKFIFHLPGGTVSWLTYTDATGRASHYENIGSSPIGQKQDVSAYVTVNGITKISTSWFMPKK